MAEMDNTMLREQDDLTSIPAPQYDKAHMSDDSYQTMYHKSTTDPDSFWAAQAEMFLDWFTPWRTVKDTSFRDDVHIKWFKEATLNVSYNCIDRHLATRGEQTAIIWEGDDPNISQHISYNTLYEEVCRFANTLKQWGVKKGDVVTLYMPMIPEAAYAMLACSRIGAIHSVVFGGFSPEALKSRIVNCKSQWVITATHSVRGGKHVPLKSNVDVAVQQLSDVHTLIIDYPTAPDNLRPNDTLYSEASAHVSADCPPEPMNAEDPLFILYTSGSTGSPKGVMHSTGGYLLYAAMTHKYVFDYQDGDIYWCTADVGWITGHSYIVYGPLANGATTLMFEGIPTYPDNSRFWHVVDKHQVTQFYTAPTAIRALMADGETSLAGSTRSSLRILGTVGEPINPEAWKWYYEQVGQSRCPVVDTWWQTETGGHLLTPLPYATAMKPGSATRPFFGAQPIIVDNDGNELMGEAEGNLCFKDSWPGQMRSVYGDHQRFIDTYFSQFPGLYFSGDGCRRDKDGYYWITGRTDDVLNVSGHRLGTAEIESALVAHKTVAEAAVVGIPHDIKGQGIYCYVTLNHDITGDDALMQELITWVRKEISPIATPDVIQWASGLPKTRSGKIMRRILRKIAVGETDDLGDTSTLLNPDIVDELIKFHS